MTYFNLIKLNATSSTNDYLKNKYKKGNVSDGDLVWTINQTSGRGQRQNKWYSDFKDSLTFSIF
jgi:BirA family biotin operon repressor/biotin-[acetyl-CoA-carboxylase] ligase